MVDTDDGLREFVDEDEGELVTERRERFVDGAEMRREWVEIERVPLEDVDAELPDQTKTDVKGDDGQE